MDRAVRCPRHLGPFDAEGAGEVSRRYEILFGQSVFTPKDTAREDPDPDDRPYAGWLYGGVGLIQDTDRRRLDHLELLAGVIGPDAFGEEAQNDYHQFIGVDKSRGWDEQLHNEPGVMLSYERKWRFLQPIGGGFAVDAIPELGITVGNVMDYVQAGGMLRFGKNLEADYGPQRIRPALSGTPYFNSDYLDGPFGFYFFVGTQGRAVARNAVPRRQHLPRQPQRGQRGAGRRSVGRPGAVLGRCGAARHRRHLSHRGVRGSGRRDHALGTQYDGRVLTMTSRTQQKLFGIRG